MKLFFALISLFMFFSCNNQTEQNKQETPATSQKTEAKASSFDTLMTQINSRIPDLIRIESLIYFKEDGSSISAKAFLDNNQIIQKIEEDYFDGQTGIRTRTNFFFHDSVLFASEKSTIKGNGVNAYFSEEITFYSSNGNLISSKERTSELEEYIDNETFKTINPIKHSTDNIYQLLKQEGAYATTFQGFVENGPYHFLIVGENTTQDGYTASLAIQEDNPTLRYLREKGKDALGQELEIDFEIHTDGMGYTVSVLKRVVIIERR